MSALLLRRGALFIAASASFAACGDDDDPVEPLAPAGEVLRFVISAAPLDSVVNTLYFVSGDGRQVQKVFNETTPAAYRDSPTWSPDGLRIAFVRYGAQGAKVYVSNVDGSAERPLVNDTRLQYDPSWSPTRP